MANNSNYSNIKPDEAVLRLNEILFSTNPNASISNAQLENIQNLLNIAGFNSGRPDGFEGPNTGNALASFLYQDATPIYNEDNPEGRVNAAAAQIITTYASAENVRNYQLMYGPISFVNDVAKEENPETFKTVERLLNSAITKANTIELQQSFESLGLAPGSIDGDFGPKTAGAALNHLEDNYDVLLSMNSDNLEFILDKAHPEGLENFQTRLRRSPEFYDLLKSKIDSVEGPLETAPSEQLIEIQQLMTAAGYYNRGIDGIFGPGTRAGLEEFNNMPRPAEVEPLVINITPAKPLEPAAETRDKAAAETELSDADDPLESTEPLTVSEDISPEVLQDIYDRLSVIDPEIVKLASININFTHGNIMRSVAAEQAYEQGFNDDNAELSKLETARIAARLTFEFPFESDVFSQEDVEQMLVEIERMEKGLHPATSRPIREVEVNGERYLISSIAEEGHSFNFNVTAQVIPAPAHDAFTHEDRPQFVLTDTLTA